LEFWSFTYPSLYLMSLDILSWTFILFPFPFFFIALFNYHLFLQFLWLLYPHFDFSYIQQIRAQGEWKYVWLQFGGNDYRRMTSHMKILHVIVLEFEESMLMQCWFVWVNQRLNHFRLSARRDMMYWMPGVVHIERM
jgi:hypothetical protein